MEDVSALSVSRIFHNFAEQSEGGRQLLLHLTRLVEWWNGRHEGLKILWPLRLCGFESHFDYTNIAERRNQAFRRSARFVIIYRY